jgi:uncharacterized protein YbjT (DUF2867 family)
MSDKSVVLTGATGMIGGLALQYALSDPAVASVTSIGRRAVDVAHPKLRQMTHEDFSDFSPIEVELKGQDVALFCLGVYTGAVPDDRFREITVDYTVAFAKALFDASPGAAFCLLSGAGADQTEKSRISFARYKGMAENALLGLGFPQVHIFRPGYIYPVTRREEPNVTYRLTRSLYPVVRRLYPNIGIPSEDLARAMLHAGLRGIPEHSSPVLENRDIRRLAERIP